MSKESILEHLTAFLRQSQKIEPDDEYFGPEVDLFDYGYLDSFGIVEFISEVEKRYGVDLSSIDFYSDEFRTLRALCEHIERKRAA